MRLSEMLSDTPTAREAALKIEAEARRTLKEYGVDPDHPDWEMLRHSDLLMSAAVVLGLVEPEEQAAHQFGKSQNDPLLDNIPAPDVLAACKERGRAFASVMTLFDRPVTNDGHYSGFEPTVSENDANAVGTLVMLYGDEGMGDLFRLMKHTAPKKTVTEIVLAVRTGKEAVAALPQATEAESRWIDEYTKLFMMVPDEMLNDFEQMAKRCFHDDYPLTASRMIAIEQAGRLLQQGKDPAAFMPGIGKSPTLQ